MLCMRLEMWRLLVGDCLVAAGWWLALARNQFAGDVCWCECVVRLLVGATRRLVARFGEKSVFAGDL